MLKRQRVLLYLIYALQKRGETATKTRLDKLLFVLRKETGIGDLVKFYNFFPYNYGPFSNQFYFDLSDLESRAHLNENLTLKTQESELKAFLGEEEKELVESIADRFANRDVVAYVYENYPEYTTKSVLKQNAKRVATPGIFSIGYEKKDIDLFLDILIQNNVEELVDIRANAFSMNFAFTKTKLSNYLNKAGIAYSHVPELGIASEHRRTLENDADYDRLFAFYENTILPAQSDSINRLLELGARKRIALLCFEQDKNYCHRSVLSKSLEAKGAVVVHL